MAQGFIGQCMTEKIEAQPAQGGVNRQLQKAFGTQAVVILDRVGRIAVMIG